MRRGSASGPAPAERTQLKEELLRGTRVTAQAASGFLGVGRVSAAEQQTIDALAASFGVSRPAA